MSATDARPGRKQGPKRSPRRLSRDARREQLIDVAMPLVAEQGIGAFSLDDVAARADVTRNLLYHYFPRGRPDILIAVGERAGHALTDGWITDDSVSLTQRMAANFGRFIEHSQEPSDAWIVHRLGRASMEPELHAIVDRFEDVVIKGIATNNFGTAEPPAIARLAIKGFVAFTETVLDEARGKEVPVDQVIELVAEAMAATLAAVRTVVEEGASANG